MIYVVNWFRNETLKLKNKASLRDFLQKSSFEAQNSSFETKKRNFSARFPSKVKL